MDPAGSPPHWYTGATARMVCSASTCRPRRCDRPVGAGRPRCGGICFSPLPLEGRWQTVLLADGNIGIGGDPAALLARCRRLLRRGGTVLVEVHAPGASSWSGQVTLRFDDRCSDPFPWARVGADDVTAMAGRGGLRVRDVWTEAQRWFAQLIR